MARFQKDETNDELGVTEYTRLRQDDRMMDKDNKGANRQTGAARDPDCSRAHQMTSEFGSSYIDILSARVGGVGGRFEPAFQIALACSLIFTLYHGPNNEQRTTKKSAPQSRPENPAKSPPASRRCRSMTELVSSDGSRIALRTPPFTLIPRA